MTEPQTPRGWFARWRAARQARPDFIKASQARIWRIVAVAVVAIVGATAAVVALIQGSATVDRLAADEACLKSVVIANSARSAVLTQLNQQRADADQARQDWNTAEQQVFGQALHIRTTADRARIRVDFARANRGYLHADARYRHLNALYNQAVSAHPVPKLNCSGGHP